MKKFFEYSPESYIAAPSIIQELAWVLGSPSLIDVEQDNRFGDFFQYLNIYPTLFEDLYNCTEPLESGQFHKTTTRVGLYFEDLVRFWLERFSPFSLLAHNAQIHVHGKTLGAFDFIVRQPSGLVEHWELGVKFYLASASDSGWENWVGLNAQDTLDKKVAHMLSRQLPLSTSPAGKAYLAALGISQEPLQRAFLKGYLFRHIHSDASLFADKAHMANYGRWLYTSELFEFVQLCPDDYWIERRKPDWLVPALVSFQRCLPTSSWLTYLDTLDGSMPLMFSRMRRLNDTFCCEYERIIVVPNQWYSPSKGV